MAGAESVASYLCNHSEDRLLAVLPFSFDYGLSQLTTAFSVGASVVLMDYLLPRVVDLQPDGDLMFDLGALWVAAKHRIPMLVVMFNNRAYYNDWEHQIRMARQRGTPVERAHIGMDIFDPEPDFAGVARSLGWYAEGPIDRSNDVGPALKRAIERVKLGQPALVDTITQHR